MVPSISIRVNGHYHDSMVHLLPSSAVSLQKFPTTHMHPHMHIVFIKVNELWSLMLIELKCVYDCEPDEKTSANVVIALAGISFNLAFVNLSWLDTRPINLQPLF